MYGTQLMNTVNPRVRQQPVNLFNGMLAQSAPGQCQSMANGAHRQGCAGHHAQRRVRQGVDPFCMQIIAKQAVEEFLGIFKLCRSLANNHWCPPARERRRLLFF